MTTLLNSGDILFLPSLGTGNKEPLPVGKKVWINQQIIKMCQDVEAISHLVSEGRNVQLKKGPFPEYPTEGEVDPVIAILWRLEPTLDQPDPRWQLLIPISELKGDSGSPGKDGQQGSPGADGSDGKDGTNVKMAGSVTFPAELTGHIEAVVGDGYYVTSTKELWFLSKLAPTTLSNWTNVGRIGGPRGERGYRGYKGDKGDKGNKGDKGKQGDPLSSFFINWIISAAVSASVSEVMGEVNAAVDAGIAAAVSAAEVAAEEAAKKAVKDAFDELGDLKGDKGEKGDKGDDGDKGADGKSVEMVGAYDLLSTFMAEYPATEANVGKAAVIGADGEEKRLWCIIARPPIAGITHYTYDDLGDLKGPKGDDAEWTVSFRDTHFVEKRSVEVVTGLPSGVAGMYIQDTDSIITEGLAGSELNPNQVGFKINMRYPIPRISKETGDGMYSTIDKVLSNDGEALKWVKQKGGSSSQDQILLKAPDGTMWALRIDNDGRLLQELTVEVTEDTSVILKSPNGLKYALGIMNDGRIQVEKIYA